MGYWRLSHRADPIACAIADRHYNRQKPGSPQFVPPGRCIVLLGSDEQSLWVTSWPFAEYTKHEWGGAWVNSCFRREGGPLASEQIAEAVAITRWKWPDVPALGIITFVDARHVRHKRDLGRCYRKAGWVERGYSKGGLLCLGQSPESMPDPIEPVPRLGQLFAG